MARRIISMKEVDAIEFETHPKALLDAVGRGEEIIITRDGQPVGRFVPETKPHDKEAARAAAQAIREMSKGMSLGPDLTIKQLIEEGRM